MKDYRATGYEIAEGRVRLHTPRGEYAWSAKDVDWIVRRRVFAANAAVLAAYPDWHATLSVARDELLDRGLLEDGRE